MASVDPITEGFTMKIPFPGVEPQIWPVAILLSCDKFWQPLSSHHPGWCVCLSLPYPPCCVSVLVMVAAAVTQSYTILYYHPSVTYSIHPSNVSDR